MLPAGLRHQFAEAAFRHAGVALLALHGSRARHGATERSDWDFAYLADPDARPAVDRLALLADLTEAVRNAVPVRRRAGRASRPRGGARGARLTWWVPTLRSSAD